MRAFKFLMASTILSPCIFLFSFLSSAANAGEVAQVSQQEQFQNSATRFQGFVEVEKGRALYVDWQKAAPGKETVVLVNGLTYDTETWNAFTQALKPYGVGVFRYDPEGMGKSLIKRRGIHDIVGIGDQARDLDVLTRKVGLTGKLNLVGLSYGGGLTIAFAQVYGARINKAFLLAPYTAPLPDQDAAIKQQIAWTRLSFPLNPSTDDQLYAYFLRQTVFLTYPYVEPSVLDNAFKLEAVFQLTQGIRQFDIVLATKGFPSNSVHLMVAEKDQYIPRVLLNEFWDSLPVNQRGSRILIDNSEHKMPEAQPKFVAKWVSEILLGHVADDGNSYEGDPKTGKVIPRASL